MFLRALTLRGFKSFADTTTLALEPGVTVVVGPNGSGKSNVVDAIAWVLGAQAPSAVRSQKMDDVIFAGTAKRPALGRAEVSLTIDNSSGMLPIEFTEVTITRTLFRTGDSDYAINGAACRLLDIQELLSDSGVGRTQHVIVSQGQIDSVLNARPEERRAVIEEAAGVLKYRKRKERAERRLESTEASLLRVQDLLREVRRQIRPLERQAEAARRHSEVVAELTVLRVYTAGREIAAFRERLAEAEHERAALVVREKDLRDELAAATDEILATETRLAALGGFDLGDQLTRAEQLTERAGGLAAVLAERRRGLERDRGRLLDTGVVANLEAEAGRMRAELIEVEAGREQLGPDHVSLLAAEHELAAERAAFEAATALPEAGQTVSASAAGAVAEVRGELRTLRAAVEQGASESGRLAVRLTGLAERSHRLDVDIERFRAECESASAAEQPLVEQMQVAEAERAVAGDAAVAGEEEQRSAQAEHSRWTARAEALSLALDEARSRAGAERLAGIDGVVGTLLDLVEVDEGWEAAFEAAAGEALSAVVVDGSGAARRALAALAEHDVAGAVLALGSHHGALDPPPLGEPVRHHVRSDRPGVGELLDSLLGSAVLIDGDWPLALDAALAYPRSVIVTRRGGRFGATSWRIGGRATGATGAALAEAVAGTERSATVRVAAESTHQSARATLVAARQREQELVRRLDAHDGRFTASTNSLSRAQSERREAATEIESLTATAYELDGRLDRDRIRIAELETVLPELVAEETSQIEAARAAQSARTRLDALTADVARRRKEFEVKGAGLEERRAFLRVRLVETEERLGADVIARADAEKRRVRVERSLGIIDRLIEVVDGRRALLGRELAELQELRRRQSEEARAVAAALDTARKRRSAGDKQLDDLRERQHRSEIEENETRIRLGTAVETLERESAVTPEQAMVADEPELPEGVTAVARVSALERELRIMGPINPLALEEFTALQERHGFLEAQLEDVKGTRRELSQVIRAIDVEIQSVFASAFADVSENFTTLFAKLFPGGTGKLTLTNPDDMLNTGIEVEAKPSGKNVKKLSLLSGGERSLTALAYLFAVFRSRPSPFYVMDEVEAALDDVNLHRFLSLVHEFRDEAQLIIVSHQKRTMEAADLLYGVSMQPGGSSKVVSERVGAGT